LLALRQRKDSDRDGKTSWMLADTGDRMEIMSYLPTIYFVIKIIFINLNIYRNSVPCVDVDGYDSPIATHGSVVKQMHHDNLGTT
jgi:hypothetical protein